MTGYRTRGGSNNRTRSHSSLISEDNEHEDLPDPKRVRTSRHIVRNQLPPKPEQRIRPTTRNSDTIDNVKVQPRDDGQTITQNTRTRSAESSASVDQDDDDSRSVSSVEEALALFFEDDNYDAESGQFMDVTLLHTAYTSDEDPLPAATRSCFESLHVPYLLDSNKPSGAELSSQIFQSLRSKQAVFMPSRNYMERQPDIDEAMRSILVDWLVEVAEEWRLKVATLYLTVSLIDRYLDRVAVNKEKLQLVGVACMWIASKIEEMFPPQVEDFVYISDNTYSREQIIKMEDTILDEMGYKTIAPTVHTFLRRYQEAGRLDEEVTQLSNFLAELTLLEYSFIKYEPSLIAACAVALALNASECNYPWSPSLERHTCYSLDDLSDCLEAFHHIHTEAPNSQLQAIREKYSAPNPYLCVANIPPRDRISAT